MLGKIEYRAKAFAGFCDAALDLVQRPAKVLRANVDDPATVDDVIRAIQHALISQPHSLFIAGQHVVRCPANDPGLEPRDTMFV